MRRGLAWTAAAGLASAGLELALGVQAHSAWPWHALAGFDFAFGLAGCALIVFVSKALGRAFLQRPEAPGEDAR